MFIAFFYYFLLVSGGGKGLIVIDIQLIQHDPLHG